MYAIAAGDRAQTTYSWDRIVRETIAVYNNAITQHAMDNVGAHAYGEHRNPVDRINDPSMSDAG